MLDRMQLRADVVLVLLAPTLETRQTPAGLLLAHALTPMACYGRVLRTGPSVDEVTKGDLVAFPPSVGEPYAYRDYALLFLHEDEISFVVDTDTKES